VARELVGNCVGRLREKAIIGHANPLPILHTRDSRLSASCNPQRSPNKLSAQPPPERLTQLGGEA
jgi:hypothetical protein